jgi:hypothetical protein
LQICQTKIEKETAKNSWLGKSEGRGHLENIGVAENKTLEW